MSIAKVIEISSNSDESFEHAIRKGIKRAGKTVKGIQGAWVSEMKVAVKDNEVTEYRVNLRVTFVVTD